ncbi:MAG: penicillin-binding protein, partial [Mycobacterium sp.]
MNNEGRHHQSPSDSAGADVGANPASGERRQVPPDDRLTSIIPSVTDDRSPRHADPVEAVKAALDAPSGPLQRDQLEQVKAALDSPAKDRRNEPLSGRLPRSGPPGGPPGPPG